MVETIDLASIEFTQRPPEADEDSWVSLWNVATSAVGEDTSNARLLASKLLGFLCKHRCTLVVASPSDAKYLDEWFERDTSLLYNWKPESDKVDMLAQHAYVPFDLLCKFLRKHKFRADRKYSPRRADRVEWFTEDWNVG